MIYIYGTQFTNGISRRWKKRLLFFFRTRGAPPFSSSLAVLSSSSSFRRCDRFDVVRFAKRRVARGTSSSRGVRVVSTNAGVGESRHGRRCGRVAFLFRSERSTKKQNAIRCAPKKGGDQIKSPHRRAAQTHGRPSDGDVAAPRLAPPRARDIRMVGCVDVTAAVLPMMPCDARARVFRFCRTVLHLHRADAVARRQACRLRHRHRGHGHRQGDVMPCHAAYIMSCHAPSCRFVSWRARRLEGMDIVKVMACHVTRHASCHVMASTSSSARSSRVWTSSKIKLVVFGSCVTPTVAPYPPRTATAPQPLFRSYLEACEHGMACRDTTHGVTIRWPISPLLPRVAAVDRGARRHAAEEAVRHRRLGRDRVHPRGRGVETAVA